MAPVSSPTDAPPLYTVQGVNESRLELYPEGPVIAKFKFSETAHAGSVTLSSIHSRK